MFTNSLNKAILSFVFSVTIVSCQAVEESNKVRFVNMNGQPGQLRLSTPSENLESLSKQGRIKYSENKKLQNINTQNTNKPKPSVNKYSQSNRQKYIQPNPSTKDASQNKELLYTVDMPTNNDQKTLKKPSRSAKNTKTTSYSKPKILSEIKISDNSSKNNNDKIVSGSYVQVGSFRSKNSANLHVNKIKKLTNNPSNVRIQPTKIKGDQYYRVVIGPITKKDTARLIIKNLKDKGQNSILIKIK